MAPKNIIGIAVDGPYLRVARLEIKKKHFRILDLQTVGLSEPVDLVSQEEPVTTFKETVTEPAGEEDLGIFEEPEESSNGNSNSEYAADINIFKSNNDFASPHDPEEESTEEKLSQLFENFGKKRLDVALSLPLGFTILHPLSSQNYKALKSKEVKAAVTDEIKSVYEPMESEVQYAYDIQDNGAMLLVSCEGENPLLDTFDNAVNLYSNKTFVREILPDEAAMIGLLRANYTLTEDQVTALVIVGEDSSRIIFLRGEDVIEVLPLLHTGKNSPQTMHTIFSKIILQLDQGNITGLDRIIFSNAPLDKGNAPDLMEHLPDVRIETLQLNPDKIEFTPEERSQIPKYLQAIAIAWAGSGVDSRAIPSLSLIPDRVHERQKVFKLEWHGVLLLSLITLAPIVFNHYYQEKKAAIETLQEQTAMVQKQIEINRPIANEVEKLAGEYGFIDKQVAFMDSLGQNAYRWSATLKRLSEGIAQLKNCWIANMAISGDKLMIEGYSLYRNRVPRLAGLFADVNIKEMVEVDKRDITLYKFIMTINRIDHDSESLNP